MNNFRVKQCWFGLLIAVIALGAGCSKEAKKDRHLERGNKAFAAGKYEVAEVEYMNVLRADGTNLVAIRNLGLMAAEQGKLGKAFVLLNRAKQSAPDDFQVRLRFAQCLLSGGGFSQARDEALALFAKFPQDEDVLLLLVESSGTTNQLRDLEKRLTSLSEKSAETGNIPLALGMIQLRGNDLKSAEQSLQKAQALKPGSSAVHVALGNLYAHRNERQKAEAAYKKAAELAQARSPHSLAYVDYKMAQKDFAKAKEALDQLVKKTPDYLPAQMRLAGLALFERRFADCESIVKKVLAGDSTHLEAMLLFAQLRSEQDQFAQAVTILEQAAKEYPKVPQLHYQLALARLKNNDEPGALQSLNEAIKIQPNFADGILLLAEVNLRRGEAAPAIAALKKLISQRTDLPGAHLLLATAYQSQGKEEEALGVYQNLGRLYPSNPQIPLRIGMLLRQKGKNAEARNSFEKALAIAPDYTPALGQLVNLDLAEKQTVSAKQRVQKKLAAETNNAALYLLLGRIHLAETNFNSAESALLKAISIAPESSEARALLSRVYVVSNRKKEALTKLQEVVERVPNDVASWLQIAQLQSASSNYPAARIAYEKILTINPQFVPALNNLAWLCLEHFDDLKLANDLASKARRLQPKDPSTADTLGWMYYRKGDFPRALALIKESAEELSDKPEVIFHLGMVHYKMGDEAAAKTAFRHALASGDHEPWRAEVELRLRVLEADFSAGNAAVPELERLLARSPDDLILLSRMAAVAERRSDWRGAAGNYEKALTINSNLIPAMVKLAQIYSAHLNNSDQALALARRARKLEPANPVIGHTLGKLAYDSATTSADFQWAFSLLQESARQMPSDAQALYDFAWATYSIGQWQDALEIMKRAAKTGSPSIVNEAEKFLRLSGISGDPLRAQANAAEVKTVLAAEPDYVPALMALGTMQEAKAELKPACDSYERVLKRFPLFCPATKQLAKLYYSLGDVTKAHGYAIQARDALPQDGAVARILGLIEFDRANYGRAAQLLADSAKNFPNDADLYFRMGIAYHKIKQSKESKQTLATALKLSPASSFATEAKKILAEP